MFSLLPLRVTTITMITRDQPTTRKPKGLFRTLLVGEGASLTSAFASIRRSQEVHNTIDIPEKNISSGQLRVPPGEGEGYWELININDLVYAVVSKCEFNDVRTEIVPPEDFLEIHVCFNGPVHLDLSGDEEFNSFSSFVYLSKQGGAAEYRVRLESGKKHMLALYIRPSVMQMFGKQDQHAPAVINKLLRTPEGSISYVQIPISIAVLNATTQIINNAYAGKSRIIYAEAKVWELLSIILDELEKNDSPDLGGTLGMISGDAVGMFEQARAILENNLESTPTISELAKMVGTNTTKLKQGFKLVFGVTIFECSHQYKMKEALRQLAVEKLNVGQVASAVGYQHQASFAAAFKGYYGILPKEAKKLNGSNLSNLSGQDMSI